MKKHRRILSLTLALILCLALLPTAAAAGNQFTATDTGVIAESVSNAEGFAMLSKLGEENVWVTMSSALMDAQGNLVCPWKLNDFASLTRQYICSDGLICWAGGNIPRYYKDNNYYLPDGTAAFALPDERADFDNKEPYYWLGAFHDGVALVRVCYGSEGPWRASAEGSRMEPDVTNCQAFLIDKTGKILARLPKSFDRVWQGDGFGNNCFFADIGAAAGGRIRIYDEGYQYSQDQAEWVVNSYGYLDYSGNTVLEFKDDYIGLGSFSEGLAAVSLDGQLWGYIDAAGKEVISPQYEDAWNFFEGLAAVTKDGKLGVIDTQGKVVIPFQFDADAFYSFTDGLAVAKKDGKFGAIDTQGNTVIPFMYDDSFGFSEGYMSVAQGDKYGLVDKNNQVVVPLEYDDIAEVVNGVAYGIKDGHVYVLKPANTAYPSTQTVKLDGKDVEFQCYALKDQSGNPTNYIKLRDLALLLSGTAAQFEVGWDGDVSITTGKAYTPNGSELKTPYSGDRTYSETDAVTKVNGQTADLAAFMLTDDQGGGYTYYQLRDLGKTLGFNVGWSADRGVYIETDRPYDPNN